MRTVFRHIIIAIPLILFQWLVLSHIRIYGAMADVLLLYVAWLAFMYGRRAGAIAGFGLGFFYDAIFGTWGVHMVLKSLMGFVMGSFPTSDRDSLLIQPRQAFLGSLALALLHNGLEIIVIALQEGSAGTYLIVSLWIGSALYTAVLGTIIALLRTR